MTQVSKTSVNYRESTGARKCGTCSMYDAAKHSCSLVRGAISPKDVCDKWVAKKTWAKR